MRRGTAGRRGLWALAVLCFTIGGLTIAQAIYIPAKAALAQILLEKAWAKTTTQTPQKPWPWADMWPAAKLRFSASEELIVLAQASGQALAFGPGLVMGEPQGSGPIIIAAHRDTHFRLLQRLSEGESIELEWADGKTRSFRIRDSFVFNAEEESIAQKGWQGLALITCYPFDGLSANTPLRYAVLAEPLE